ncbi:MAG: enoyl-CoA hydratase/isomerase family protein [Reyranellaceae bacterium]
MSAAEPSPIRVERAGPVLHLWLNRPEARNAMTRPMQREILALFESIRDDRSVRVVVIRGAGKTFSAGGDIKNMQAAGGQPAVPSAVDEVREGNRRGGLMLHTINTAPQVVIAVVEGFALGGGVGLSCVADITIAHAKATFALTEVTLGVVPATISPFVVGRIGLTQARYLGVTGARLSGVQAGAIGLAQIVAEDDDRLEAELKSVINRVLRCAPQAVAETKRLMLRAAGALEMETIRDLAADAFVRAVRGPEGREGTLAFVEKRKPGWVETIE